jgi:hypothetical protein
MVTPFHTHLALVRLQESFCEAELARRSHTTRQRSSERATWLTKARVAIAAMILLIAIAMVPALASAAPTVRSDQRCYTPGQTMNLAAAGFTPNDDIVYFMALSGQHGSRILYTDPSKSDATGALTTQVRAPALASDSDTRETLALSALDQTLIGPNPAADLPEGSFAVTQFLISDFDVTVDAWESGIADPLRTSRVQVTGWEPYHVVWAHYFLGRTRVRSIRIGAVSGPCGDLTRTIRQFPFHPVKAGRWTVYFSPSQVFDRDGMWVRSRHVLVPKRRAVA